MDKIGLLRDGRLKQIRLRLRFDTPASGELWLLFYCRMITVNDIRRLSGFLVDVTREAMRENMQDQLATHNDLLQTVLNVGIFEYDQQKQVFWRSRGYCDLFDLNPQSETLISLDRLLAQLPESQRDSYLNHLDFKHDQVNLRKLDYQLTTSAGKTYKVTETVNLNSDRVQGVVHATLINDT